MAEIKITKKHNLDPADLKARLMEIESAMKEKFALTTQWNGDTVELKGMGVKKGFIAMRKGEVEVYIQLGLMALPFKDKIEASVQRHLAKHLGEG